MSPNNFQNAPSLKEAFDMALQEYVRLMPLIEKYSPSFFKHLTYAQLPPSERPKLTLDNLYDVHNSEEISLLELHILRSPMTYYNILLNDRNGLGIEANIKRYLDAIAETTLPNAEETVTDRGTLANNAANQLYHHILKEVKQRLGLDVQIPSDFFTPKI